MSYSYVDDTLFGSSKRPNRTSGYIPNGRPTPAGGVVIDQSTLDSIRDHATPSQDATTRTLSIQKKFDKTLLCKARTENWGNTLANQQKSRLSRVRTEAEARDREIADLAAAYEKRKEENRKKACGHCDEILEKEEEHNKLMATAHTAATVAKWKVIADRERGEKQQKEKEESIQLKNKMRTLYEEELEGNRIKKEKEKELAHKIALEYDETFKLHDQMLQEQKTEKQRELEKTKKAIAEAKAQKEEEEKEMLQKKRTYKKLLDKSVEEQQRLHDAEKKRIRTLDRLQYLTDQHKDEMATLNKKLQEKARAEQDRRKENIFNVCAKEVSRAEAERTKMLDSCCLAELETARKEKAEREKQEKLERQKQDVLAVVDMQNIEKAAAKVAERTTDILYGRKLIDEVERADKLEKQKQEEAVKKEREFYAKVNADIKEKARRDAELKHIQDELDKNEALRSQKEIQRGIDNVEKMIQEEEDPDIKRAYAQVKRKLIDRTRKINWMDDC